MDKQRIIQYKSTFDEIAHFITDENDTEQVEVWFARELQNLLGYSRWENFMVAIQRALDSCKTQGTDPVDHFRDLTKMIEIGKGGTREVSLSRLDTREKLRAAEDINKLERRVVSNEKKIEKTTRKLPKK
ncbi:MAG: hypothetical protein LBN93_11695 [Candidatus Symbiothrix sp.]|jgi:hypothetical protein|nr:hypothetical protein [Candidatus Symbiothrix sp.]